jgi:hypothetical protein
MERFGAAQKQKSAARLETGFGAKHLLLRLLGRLLLRGYT